MHKHRNALFPWGGLTALIAFIALGATGCAQTGPLTLAHPASGLRLALPAGFVDDTAEARHRLQDRGSTLGPDLSIHLAASFNDDIEGRGCLLNHLTVRGDLRREWSEPAQVALRVSSLQGHALAQTDPWPLLRAGQRLAALPGQPPVTDTVQRSGPAAIGGRPGWLVLRQQTWPAQSGPLQGVTRLATLALPLPSPTGQTREWMMVHCRAVHLPDYLPGYMDEMIELVTSAQWAGAPVPE